MADDKRKQIEAKYFSWLLSHIDGGSENLVEEHMDTLIKMGQTEFTVDPAVPDDYNRVRDAYAFREMFCDDLYGMEIPYGFVRRNPSVLEVLVALSVRCELDVMYDHEVGDRTSEWFWAMFFGLGLERFRDPKEGRWDEFTGCMEDFMSHKIGLFVAKNFLTKPGKVTKNGLWQQLCRYLEDKF